MEIPINNAVNSAAIIDLPYNLCSRISEAERLDMLASVRRLAGRAIIIATEPIEDELARAGLSVTDGCIVHKGRFSRRIWVCAGS